MKQRISIVVTLVVALYGGETSWAGSHLWTVNELFSNADGTIQFVEMHCPLGANSEVFVNGKNFTSQATGGDFTVTGLSLSNTSDKHLLFATADFAALPNAPTPDFIIPPGSVPFIGIGVNETIHYCPACGYDSLSFSAGALPTDGVNSLNFDLTTGTNSPTNFAGDTGTVNANPVPTVSTWGLVVLALLVLASGSAVLAHGRARRAPCPA